MGKALEKQRAKSEHNVKIHEKLQKVRNIDFPSNMRMYYEMNYAFFKSHYNDVVCDITYSIKGDSYLVVFIYNYIASVKAYLNRKRRLLDKLVPAEYQTGINAIYYKFHKQGRNETSIDKVVLIRDAFEHDAISDISLDKKIYEDRIDYILKYKDIDLVDLFFNCNNELSYLNTELNRFVEDELKKLELRHNILFLNAFNRKIGKDPYSFLLPEESEDEKKRYDLLVLELFNQD